VPEFFGSMTESLFVQPGLTTRYVAGESTTWGLSAGVFASGEGAEFGGVGGPMVIVQAEFSPKQINGEPQTYVSAIATRGARVV